LITPNSVDRGGKTTMAQAPIPRKRLSGPEREQAIVEEAVRFFAEVGFDGDTRQLAQRLGVTQSLMYKYFPSKAALIDRVYEEVYLGRWNPFWETVIRDRTIPLEDRLVQLYVEYAKAPVAEELRHELGLPAVAEVPFSVAEIELVWSINARIFYFGQRRWIFDVPIEAPLEEMIELTIRHFMAGARAVLPGMVVPVARKPQKSARRR